ncbi:MAG: PilZ domain-containing protein [Acidobacteriota bacterium]|nr:PilZ domain-containing protein [Acidobacteriota bacterium]
MTSSPSERRENTRYPVEGVRGTFLFTTDAQVLNMSLDGMSIETSSPLKVGRQYSLKLEEHGNALPLRGVVVWCSLVKTTRSERGEIKPVYKAGIHFEDLLTKKASDLKEFIRHNAVISLENRLFGRFRIEPQQSADLSFEADFSVRQLSMSGMLIETDVAPAIESRCHMSIRLAEIEFETFARIARVDRIERPLSKDDEMDEEKASVVFLGIEFIDMGDEARESLQSFIETEQP